MSISFVAALTGTVLAAAGTGLAIRLCARRPRTDMVAWVMALAGLTVGLAAQAAGYRRGFVPTTFRATQLGAALIAPLSLAWGMAELAAKGLVARFAARLGLAGLFVVAAVILATDVLSARPFSQRWPAARDHFEFLPLGLLALVAVAVVLTVVVALSATGLRSRGDPAWRPALAAVGLASVAALATQALQVALPADTAYPAVTAIAAVAAWLAARQAARVSVARIRGGPASPGPGGPGARGGGPGYAGDDSLDLYGDGYRRFEDSEAFAAYTDSGYGETGGYQGAAYGSPRGAGRGGADRQPDQYGGQYDDTGGFSLGGYPGTGSFPLRGPADLPADTVEPVTGAFDPLFRPNGSAGAVRDPAARDLAASNGAGKPGEDIEFATGMQLPVIDAAAAGPGPVDTDLLYGRIAIYTLLDSGADEFDRLADQVVEQVRTGEPETLAYVVHSVPSAPLQRILYQLYADRDAYDRHQERPYVTDFESRRRPLVLATNVIELGVRQAKVAAVTPRRVP